MFAALAINLAMAVDNTVYHIKPTFGYWKRKRNVSLIFLPGTHKLSTEMEATELVNLDFKWKVFSGRVDIKSGH